MEEHELTLRASKAIPRALQSDCDRALQYYADKSKIKLTKTLPTEEGWYYWAPDDKSKVTTEFVDDSLEVFMPMVGFDSVSDLGGYWAKVDQSMFEIEG